VEDEKEDDEDGLVEQLTPTLHEEGEDDVPAAVEPVVVVGPGADSLGFEC